MKILLLDIETAPNRVYSWGLFKQNIALSQIEEPGYTMCWAAKWLGEDGMYFSSIQHETERAMLHKVHVLLDEADMVVHYNGSSFDIPTLNKEFIAHDMVPPAPVQEIDLLKTCRSRFRFLSNKLDYVAGQLGCDTKVQHKGMDLWRGCMAGNAEDWAVMEEYNKRDVEILEQVYAKLLPWIQPHPNVALYHDGTERTCPNCGGHHLQARGYSYTNTQRYQRYQCQGCGKWSRERVNDTPKDKAKSLLTGVK
jgi:hypothetical protein